jgi:hypothetical protein
VGGTAAVGATRDGRPDTDLSGSSSRRPGRTRAGGERRRAPVAPTGAALFSPGCRHPGDTPFGRADDAG